MAMSKASIQWEHREISFKNKPQEMLALSNKGTVPVLLLEDGTIIDESLDIMLWALEQNDPDRWMDVDFHQAIQLIFENDFEFKPNLDRYKYHVQGLEYSQQYFRNQGERFLERLNDCLKNTNGLGLLTKRITIADIAIFPFVRQFAGVSREWFGQTVYNYLNSWLKRVEEHHDFLSVMQRYDFWISSKN